MSMDSSKPPTGLGAAADLKLVDPSKGFESPDIDSDSDSSPSPGGDGVRGWPAPPLWIVLLTLAINIVLWPIRHRTMLSMKRTQEKMKHLQPRVQSIKERYRKAGKKDIDSRQKMNQEVMAI